MRLLYLLAAAMFFTSCTSRQQSSPDVSQLVRSPNVIYELFVRDFSAEGTFRGAANNLNRLDDLGVDVVWLMPIHPIGEIKRKGSLGSPYSIQDYYAVDPQYGSESDFRALVDAVHERGMKIIIDFVANHSAWDNAWVADNPDWYTKDEDGQIVSPVDDWSDVADFNYDNPAVHAEMTNVLKYWVEEYDIDGYRCDVAELVPDEFWLNAIQDLRGVKDVFMLAEGEDPRLYSLGFDATYSWKVYKAMKAIWNGSPATSLFDVLQQEVDDYPNGGLRMRFTTNHDETAWDATPLELFGGEDGARAAATVAASLPGPLLLYNGQEVADTTKIPLFEKVPVKWNSEGAADMRSFYVEIADLKKTYSALQSGAVRDAGSTDDVLAYTASRDGESIDIVVNTRSEVVRFRPLETVFLAGELLLVQGDVRTEEGAIELAPNAFAVYRR